jgi:hypothetical protein
MFEDWQLLKLIAENIILVGGALGAIGWGVRHIYTVARNVEKLVESSEKSTEEQAKISEKLAKHSDDLARHIQEQQQNDHKRDDTLKDLGQGFSSLRHDLHGHTAMEEKRDLIRDEQLLHIIREISPNGGSSMKDVLNATKAQLGDVHTRVAVLEQWKADRPRAKNDAAKKTVKKRTK